MNRPERKRRTRQHIIADLSTNYVERTILACGYSIERIGSDYGYDLLMFTYDANGEVENGLVHLQIKATDSPNRIAGGNAISFGLDRRDLALWLAEPYPVILVVYDAESSIGYWLHIQDYFSKLADFSIENAPESLSVHMSTSSILDEDAVRLFARYRDNAILRFRGGTSE